MSADYYLPTKHIHQSIKGMKNTKRTPATSAFDTPCVISLARPQITTMLVS